MSKKDENIASILKNISFMENAVRSAEYGDPSTKAQILHRLNSFRNHVGPDSFPGPSKPIPLTPPLNSEELRMLAEKERNNIIEALPLIFVGGICLYMIYWLFHMMFYFW